MRIFSQKGYLTVDFSARKLTLVGRGIGMKLPGFEEFGVEQAGWQDHDALAAEHEAFFASCSMARRWWWMPRPASARWRRR